MRGRSGSVFLLASSMSLGCVASEINCKPMDPGIKASSDDEAKIALSVDGIYRVAKVGGEVSGKIASERQNLPENSSDVIVARWQYLLCETLRTSTSLSDERKIAIINVAKTPPPPPPAPPPRPAAPPPPPPSLPIPDIRGRIFDAPPQVTRVDQSDGCQTQLTLYDYLQFDTASGVAARTGTRYYVAARKKWYVGDPKSFYHAMNPGSYEQAVDRCASPVPNVTVMTTSIRVTSTSNEYRYSEKVEQIDAGYASWLGRQLGDPRQGLIEFFSSSMTIQFDRQLTFVRR